VKELEVCYTHAYEGTHQTLWKRGEQEEGEQKEEEGSMTEGDKLFKVHYMHVWNYHNEIPL
jgi:hypothetical protein